MLLKGDSGSGLAVTVRWCWSRLCPVSSGESGYGVAVRVCLGEQWSGKTWLGLAWQLWLGMLVIGLEEHGVAWQSR